jgi:hypothetical protein
MDMERNWETFPPARKQKKVQVRFVSDDILESMKRLAREDNRSLNGEIMQALREFINRRK